jgi:molybdenum cofactor synthesis domain-containing protein
MRPFTSIISLDEARRRLHENATPIQRTERVQLRDAQGRVSAADLASPTDVPPFSRSAMDGYALIAADTRGAERLSPARLRLTDRIFTGQRSSIRLESGLCAEIATGAPLPEGADAVVMVEETMRAAGDTIEIFAPASQGQNIGRQGADMKTGDVVVRCGDYLNPSRIGALAAIGCADLLVYARPRVAVVSTGNEVVEPGIALAGAQIYDVNRFTLSAVIETNGGTAERHAPVPDAFDALVRALDRCADADIIVFSGGSSVGDRDLIADLVAARGQMIFHGIAVRPGKPTAFAIVDGKPLFGMPGNPTSCLSNAFILFVPFLRTAARLPVYAPRTVRVPLGMAIVSPAGRHQFYTVRLRDGAAYPAFKGSGEITSLSRADGYIEIPSDQSTVEEGKEVEVTLF